MSVFDFVVVLEILVIEYVVCVVVICWDLVCSYLLDFVEQVVQCQNDEVFEGLFVEVEVGMCQVGLVCLCLVEGCYGYCECCGEVIELVCLVVLFVVEYCLCCVDLVYW